MDVLISINNPNQQKGDKKQDKRHKIRPVFFPDSEFSRITVPEIKVEQRNPQTIQWFIDEMHERKTNKEIDSGSHIETVKPICQHFNRRIYSQH